ncbi:hypothetical protein NB699_001644 [Xanthomonas sacchari]|uniref:Uncharacterized protein n=1 Tax=Xanthomonas sacchari TaxID=56458 RepID=A0AA46PZF2_9XANT|nr:hypothetical protein [Xanthomonas sacchari]MCW0366661.1 hypothetical protein [Xanthomonas sacchari]MCW0440314.1 hypothetical protein [Xanthomonas sacchari]UYK87009.1 hypothetical protein NG824_10720 [Xanthomonas sacchari]
MRGPSDFRLVFAVLSVLLAIAPAQAQEGNEARLRDALRDTSARLRQAEAALVQQQLATAAAERERDALRATPPPRSADPGREAALQRQLQQLRQEHDAALSQQRSQQQAQQQAAQRAAQDQQALAAQQAQLRQERARARDCAAASAALYASARELAALYRDPAFVRFVRSHGRELFGMARVTRENRVRQLEDRLAEQDAQAQACAAPAPPLPIAAQQDAAP